MLIDGYPIMQFIFLFICFCIPMYFPSFLYTFQNILIYIFTFLYISLHFVTFQHNNKFLKSVYIPIHSDTFQEIPLHS